MVRRSPAFGYACSVSDPISLSTPIDQLPGVTKTGASGLRALGLTNLGKLLAHLPMRHERHEAESTVSQIVPGHISSARGEITATRVVQRGRRPRFEAVLMDDTGRVDLTWFNGLYLRDRIVPGLRLRVQGKAQRFGPGVQMVNPQFEILPVERSEPGLRDARLRPVYPASERVNSAMIERTLAPVLDTALAQIEDHLPEEYRKKRDLMPLRDAYRAMHRPSEEEETKQARRRLAYDEFLLLQLGVHLKRAHLRERLRAPALRHDAAIDARIRERFPFTLTPAQESVLTEIIADLSRPVPTNRLIQGDVGSGKTVVALYAMMMAVASGEQAALMAPTEILAEQHHANISRMLQGSKVRVELLTGSIDKESRESILARLESGAIDIVIGTHALLTEKVKWRSLALAIIDEQHRFGVHQRSALRAKGEDASTTPHVLVMTATPIPRTVAITLFGDLDISTIRGLPPGRTPIRTRVVNEETRPEVYTWLRERLDKGEQAYVVVPAIDTGESDGNELKDVRSLMRELETGPLEGLKLAALHGRLKRATRDATMERFRAGSIAALVATTVIEVGVDVPNASVMIVEHADRFGLAQLHQLRGRVGRGTAASVCVLIGDAKTEEGKQRLQVMQDCSDGFVLAEKDLEIRGPGELLGTKQSGLPPFKVADLAKDLALLAVARRDAAEWVARSPRLDQAADMLVKRRLMKAYGEALGLADVG